MNSRPTLNTFFTALLLLNIFVTIPLNAQFFSTGSDPARAKWMYIETADHKIIYPKEIDSLARRYAFYSEHLRDAVFAPLRSKPSKSDIVLHPYNLMSNGMVGLAPKRIELITRPPWDSEYHIEWAKHLIIHELRHLAQVNKFERGIFKPLGWLIGEQAAAIGVGLYMNTWKLEGDAVVAETALSSAGRGRDPDHLMYFRAAFLNNDFRSWHRWTLGSYKDYVPDVYSFGYMMSSFIRFNSGNYYYIDDVTRRIVNRFYNPWADRGAYRDFTGMTKKENFEYLKNVMTSRWSREDSLRGALTPYNVVNLKQRKFTSYLNLIESDGDTTFALKSDLGRIRRLVKIDPEGEEHRLKYMGRVSSPIVINQDKLYWTEFIGSPRWEMESFSDIFSYDLKTGSTSRHTRKGAHFALHFSNNELFTVTYPVEGSSAVTILDSQTFGLKESVSAPFGAQLKEVVSSGGLIYAILLTEKGAGIYVYDRATGVWSIEVKEQSRSLKNLRFSGGELFFVSDLNGVNNIYCYSPESKFLRRLTNSRFGVASFSFSKNQKELLYSDFSHKGYSAVKADQDSMLWAPADFSKPYKDEIAEYLSLREGFKADTVVPFKTDNYKAKRYSKLSGIINIHSWAPVYYNIDNIKSLTYESVYDIATPGFILYSQNSLSTAFGMAGYSWRAGFHSGHFKFTYRGLYPVIEIKADINDRDRFNSTLIREPGKRPIIQKDTIKGRPYLNSHLLVYVPLTFNSGGWYRGVVPKMLWRYTNDSFFSYDNDKFSNYQYLNFGVNFYSVMGMSHRDLFPRFGAGASFQIASVPFAGENFGSIIYSSLYGYLPGIGANHGVKLSVAAQKQFYENKNYLMSSLIGFPRGYSSRYSRWAAGVMAEYAMPLFTGDLSLTSLLYIKRVQMIPFISFTRNGSERDAETLYSAGSDIIFDVNLIGISYPLEVGVRAGYTGEKRSFFEFLFKTPL
jgi:hypothetical protein